MMVYDISEGPYAMDRAAFERNACTEGKAAKDLAKDDLTKFKPTMNAEGTSGTFSPSALLYDHVSRYFDATVKVPVTVWRSMDAAQHLSEVARPGLAISGYNRSARMNHAGWQMLVAADENPDKYSPTDELITEDRKQIFGVFKDAGKRKHKTKNPTGTPDTLYFNAFTEDLFVWENDLDGDNERRLQLNEQSSFFNAMTELALDETIAGYLSRYADFEFDFTYKEVEQGGEKLFKPDYVSFSKGGETNIKVSRGEQNIFIWCVFMAICERMLDGHESYQGKKYLYIDDPISSLDDNNAISVACDLAKLLRRAATRKDADGNPAPIKVIFSSHHALFFNVMCNEVGRKIDDAPSVAHRRYFLHRPSGDGTYILQATEDTPFFHHVASRR